MRPMGRHWARARFYSLAGVALWTAALILTILTDDTKAAGSFQAQCTGISDGDTLRVLLTTADGKREQRIRLEGIDAPEKNQPYGTQAKAALSALAFGKTLTIYTTGNDRYGRLLARLECDGVAINAALVQSGAAWWYRKYAPNDRQLAQLESDARANRRGLWNDARPVPPWEWRKR